MTQPLPTLEWVGSTPVERIEGRLVDHIVMNMIRHHAPEPRDAADLLAYLSEGDGMEGDGVDMTRLSILLRHLGRRVPLELAEMTIKRPSSGALIARIDFGPDRDMTWRGGTLSIRAGPLPETIATRMTGRPLGDVLDHPYLHPSMPIAHFSQTGPLWRLGFERSCDLPQ